MTDKNEKQKVLVARGEKVVLGFCSVNAVLGGIPFITGPLLIVSDYVLFLAVKRAMESEFVFSDVFSLVAPAMKQTFAIGMFKAVADAFGWSWWVTIPVGAVVAAATTYGLGMVFVHFNARQGEFSPEDAESTMRASMLDYVQNADVSDKTRKMALKVLKKLWKPKPARAAG